MTSSSRALARSTTQFFFTQKKRQRKRPDTNCGRVLICVDDTISRVAVLDAGSKLGQKPRENLFHSESCTLGPCSTQYYFFNLRPLLQTVAVIGTLIGAYI